MKVKILSVLAILSIAFIVLFMNASKIAISLIKNQYHIDDIGSLSFKLGGVELYNVKAQRPGIKAELDKVVCDWNKNIDVYGGNINVDDALRGKNKGSSQSNLSIQASGLTVHINSKQYQADLKGVNYAAGVIQARSGNTTLTIKGHSVKILMDVIRVKLPLVEVERFSFDSPVSIPKLDNASVFGQGLKANTESKEFGITNLTLSSGKYYFKVSGINGSGIDQSLSWTDGSVVHPWLTTEQPITIPSGNIQKKENIVANVGDIIIEYSPHEHLISGSGSCSSIWNLLGNEPIPNLSGKLSGSVSFENMENAKVVLQNSCQISCSDKMMTALKGPFDLNPYRPDGKTRYKLKVGPGTDSWILFEDLPPDVPMAFVTLEDPGFFKHSGVIAQALTNSLKDNIELGRFFRGGSTITMQLARNLWLSRTKTISRKVSEIILAHSLESCFSKQEILELYLNIVEFGPDTYGIGPASAKFFEKPAYYLAIDEAFYLASRLPRPTKSRAPDKGGMESAHRLMKILSGRGVLNPEVQASLDELFSEVVNEEVDDKEEMEPAEAFKQKE